MWFARAGVFPLWGRTCERTRVEEGGESMGLGSALGVGPFWGTRGNPCSPGATIPLESLGLVEVPGAREQKAEPFPNSRKPDMLP